MDRLVVFMLAFILASCSSAVGAPPQTPTPLLTVQTGAPIISVTGLGRPKTEAVERLAIAHGDRGVSVIDVRGTPVWRSEEPATLVAAFPDKLLVYRQIGDGTRLDRFDVTGEVPVLEDSQSPSEVAATTLQRTSYALLGPLRIEGRSVRLYEGRVEFDRGVVSVAAADGLVGVHDEPILIVGHMDGEMSIYDLASVRKAAIPDM